MVEPSVSQKCQGHHWMKNWMLYSTMGSEWGQLYNKKKKKWKERFFRYITGVVTWKFHEHCLFSGWTKRLTELPRAPLDAKLNALFNHGVRMRRASQQKKENEKKYFFNIYQYHSPTLPRKIGCFLIDPGVSRKSQRLHWMQNWMLYSTIGSEWDQLDHKKKRKWKKRFFFYITAVVNWVFHEHWLFSGWTKGLTEKPRAPLDAELYALFNHGVRMRPAWQQKKKNEKKGFFCISQQ